MSPKKSPSLDKITMEKSRKERNFRVESTESNSIHKESSNQNEKVDQLSWIHSFIFTTTCLLSYFYWIFYLPHENFKSSTLSGDVHLKQICRQLKFMINNPIDYDIDSFHFWGMDLPVWNVFFSIEVILLSARFLTIQMTREYPPFHIPEIFRPAMIQFGMNPSFYEKLIASVYGYYEMYDTFMRDLYLIISLIGLSVFTAAIASSLGLCY